MKPLRLIAWPSLAVLIVLSTLPVGTKAEVEVSVDVQPIQKLIWLLGLWNFEDAEVHGENWERGTRDCMPAWTDDGIVKSNDATIQYNGSDQYVWQIRNGDLDIETGKRSVGFIDTVRRRLD